MIETSVDELRTWLNPVRDSRDDKELMSRHMSFIGQRADKVVVQDVAEGGDGMRGTLRKEVDVYTITCPECPGDGYYDERGEIVCENCGLVLSHDSAVVNVEYEGGRGFEKEHRGREGPEGPTRPSPR